MPLTPDWIYRTNIYEVNIRQYTTEGTIQAFRKHLPRLREMGVETLWLMPLTRIAQKMKKGSLGSYYASADFYSVDEEFGSLEDVAEMIRDAHERGFKVILDWVANHTGWDHQWTVDHPHFYRRDAQGNFLAASGMDDIIELDYSNPEMRMAMIRAMQFWIEKTGIDGFRCDLAYWVEVDFWKQAREALEQVKPLFFFGELDPADNPEYMEVFDAGYTWKWMHGTSAFYKEKLPLSTLTDILSVYLATPGIKTWFTSNHDENSWNGTEYEKYGDAALALAVFSCTWNGIPLIYSGQELPNKKRLKFFDKDVIEWKEETELHDFYKTLLSLRQTNPSLSVHSTVIKLTTDNDEQVLAYSRRKGIHEVLVMLNFSERECSFSFPGGNVSGAFINVFSKERTVLSVDENHNLPAWGYLVLERNSI